MVKKKVLLMGKAHSGKTSMRSIIFANYLARDTMRLAPTLDVEHHHVRFLGDLVLNLWDCGGQDAFYESYFERDRESIFRSVEMLIYVLDIESENPESDFEHFAGVLEAIEENSPDARIFVLVHKMDLVAEEERGLILEDRRRLIAETCHDRGFGNSFECFGTSIWDETLYKAWSEIVTNLIPNIGVLESHLCDFCRVCDADEVVLFERATFLVISHAESHGGGKVTKDEVGVKQHVKEQHGSGDTIEQDSRHGIASVASEGNDELDKSHNSTHDVESAADNTTESKLGLAPQELDTPSEFDPQQQPNPISSSTHKDDSPTQTSKSAGPGTAIQPKALSKPPPPKFDAHRFEKISNIVKQFKLSCGKTQSQFQGMQVSNSRFTAVIDAFTINTYIMVIVSDRSIPTEATLLNIRNARGHFERFIPRS